MLIKKFDKLGEVGKRPCQAIDLIDHHNVDEALPDILRQALEGRAFQTAT